MRRFLTDTAVFFKRLMFSNALKFAVLRSAAAFILAVIVIVNPFAAAYWFRMFIGVFCAGTFLIAVAGFNPGRKMFLFFFLLFFLGIAAVYYGRGDAVSGIGIAIMCGCTGVALLLPERSEVRYCRFMRMMCAAAAFFVSLAVVVRCGQLGVRFLDQLHSYALALAGCGFANLLLIQKERI